MYYTECKPKNKKWGRPGNEARSYACYTLDDWCTLFAHVRDIPSVYGIRKIAYTYHTLVTYRNRACSFHTLITAPDDLLLGGGGGGGGEGKAWERG